MIQSISPQLCVGCGKCVRACPLDVIRLSGKKAEIVYPEDCMTCYVCELGCPVGAIFVHPFKATPPEVVPGILEIKEGGTK